MEVGDTGVTEDRQRLDLADEARLGAGIVDGRSQDLQRDVTLRVELLRPVHGAHAAVPDDFVQLVAVNRWPERLGQRRGSFLRSCLQEVVGRAPRFQHGTRLGQQVGSILQLVDQQAVRGFDGQVRSSLDGPRDAMPRLTLHRDSTRDAGEASRAPSSSADGLDAPSCPACDRPLPA